ncbi:MAG TPA: hypothetical protein VG369_08905, partial [Humibacter sp.]|nr:hypothetical protein [Humibacter sp.]
DSLVFDLKTDPDRDVDVRDGSLYVKGLRFAYLVGDSLAVKLPSNRADDLVAREIATFLEKEPGEASHWVAINDVADWGELAAEAHTYAHGPLPGGAS